MQQARLWQAGLASLSVASVYGAWYYYQNLPPIPALTAQDLTNNDLALVYITDSPQKPMLQRLADHTLPAFLLSPTAANQLPIENVDPDNSLHVVKRLSGKSVACPLMFDDKFNAWL